MIVYFNHFSLTPTPLLLLGDAQRLGGEGYGGKNLRSLSIELAQWLTTDVAQDALEQLASQNVSDQYLIPLLVRLRKRYSVEEAAALVDQARLRRKAVTKFGAAAQSMLFLDEALQQASGQVIAGYRAQRYAAFEQVADLGCGIGGDALALAAQCDRLLAVELDPIRACFARYNLHMAGKHANFEVISADWTTYAFPSRINAAFADPTRRINGRRVFSLHQMQPPLSAILTLREQLPHVGVKVMPGVRYDQLPTECEVEWITEDGTCKEAILWFGALRSNVARRATILQKATERLLCAKTLTSNAKATPSTITPPRAFLWEPDPSVIRATLVKTLAYQLKASQLDSQIAYLTSDDASPTPFARCWSIIEHAPFHLKTLNRRLRALDAYVVTVKKRGSPIDPERFRRRLKSKRKGRPVTVFISKCKGKAWMIICGEEIKRDEKSNQENRPHPQPLDCVRRRRAQSRGWG